MRIVFLVSGNGGNLRFINSIKNEFGFEIVSVIADRNCQALEYAAKENIEFKILNFDRSKESNAVLINELNQKTPDIIVTNVHKIIHEDVLTSVNSNFINLHYSILPAFAGEIGYKTVERAMTRQNRFHGVTVHKVSKEVDQGDTIVQSIYPLDESSKLKQLNFEAGCVALLNSFLYLRNEFKKTGFYNNIMINPCSDILDSDKLNEVFIRLNND